MQKIRHQFFPVNKKTPEHLVSVIKVFNEYEDKINSHKHKLDSNTVLETLRKNLEGVGFRIETGKKKRPPKKFWRDKIERNMKRDRKVTRKLRADGWSVVRLWEHDIEMSPEKCVGKIRRCL